MADNQNKDGAFDHPEHGSFDTPEAVLKDDRLSDSQKHAILEEWHSALQHVLRNDPNVPEIKARSEEIHAAMKSLAGKG